MIYLDSAATTLIKPVSVENAVVNALRTMSSPGRGGYESAVHAAETVFACRSEAAALFNVDDEEKVVFTFNATHGLNIAISSLVKDGSRVLISGYEHNSVTRPLHAAKARITVAGRKLFDRDAVLDDFRRHIPESDLVVCTYVSNVFGFILPIYEIAEECARSGVPLIVDASQAAGILELDFARLHAAFAAMPGHKGLMGPQGTGILLCGEAGMPLLHGGSGSDSLLQLMPEYLPDRLEAGTHNVCGIAGLCAGIKYVRDVGTHNITAKEKHLLDIAARELSDDIYTELFTGAEGTQTGVLSIRSRVTDCETMAEELYSRGICVRSGLHCAPTAHESAGTLKTGTVRLSFSPFVTEEQVLAACGEIKEINAGLAKKP